MIDGSVSDRLNTATQVAKNSAAMFIVAVLTRGAGLIVAALVARHLGPAALGTFAVIMGLAQMLEVIAPLGQRCVLIREVAKDRSRLFAYWMNASLVTAVFSMGLSVILVLLVRLGGYDATVLASVYLVSLFVPVSGLRLVAQAVLQGLERMEYLAVSAFVGRVLGLLLLWAMLRSGVGVVAAFAGHALFQFSAWLALVWAILRQSGHSQAPRELRPDLDLCRTILRVSYPFAIQVFLTKALLRVNTVILPMFLTMEAIGMFDAADRVRQASAMIIPLVTMAILPTLSRAFVVDREKCVTILEKTLKLLLTLILPFVTTVAIAADQIVPFLYGPGYQAAIPVLRTVIWSQIFLVADEVLNQILMASGNERPMVRRTALSLGANVALTLLLTPRYGALGVAWSAVLTRALNLGLDAHFVVRNVLRVNVAQAIGKPFLCAVLSGGIAFALCDQGLYVLLALSAGSYVALLLIFRVFSPDELLMLRQMSGRLWRRGMIRK